MSLTQVQKIALEFDTINLDEMDNVQLMNRVDTKFTFIQEKLIEILPLLMKDYRILDVNGVRISEYESLYYDDADLNLYVNHHRKRLDRFKIRFRRYINSDIAFLEVKHKKNGRTRKRRIAVDGIANEMTTEQMKFVKKTGIKKSKNLIPSLSNDFSRITLVSRKFDERLTFDLNLTFKWKEQEKTMDNIVIAELKQGKAMRNSPFYQLMKDNQIRPLRISKYCIGIITMYGVENVKYNRFKKKLLKIKKLQTNAA